MNYELKCEGFATDDELREQLLLCGRKLVLELGDECPIEMLVKQIDGTVQGRVDLLLPNRRMSASVRRDDPVLALNAAIEALGKALNV